MKLRKPFLTLAALAFVTAAIAQQPAPADGPIDAALRASTIEQLAQTMKDEYVFADLGAKIAEDLRARLKKGEYDSIATGRALAQKLREDMTLITKDAHLSVRFSLEKLPPRQEASTPTAEEENQYRDFVRRVNSHFQKVERLTGNVGYLEFTQFAEAKDVARPMKAAMDFLSDTDALIIDLRRNGGGHPEGVQLVCSYLFGEKVHLNSIYERKGDKTTDYWTLTDLPGTRYLNKDVYVLVSKRTGSGAEECAYNLKNLKRATIIGENTWGGANPGDVFRLNDHFSAFVPTGRAINPITKTNWEGTGVDPDIRVDPAQALKHAHKLAIEKLLAKATSDQDKQRYQSVLKEIEAGN